MQEFFVHRKTTFTLVFLNAACPLVLKKRERLNISVDDQSLNALEEIQHPLVQVHRDRTVQGLQGRSLKIVGTVKAVQRCTRR